MKAEIDEIAAFQSFRDHLQTMTPISDALWSLMTSKAMRITTSKKGELLLEEGAVCRHIYFIYKGAFRFLYLKDEQEITTALFAEGVCMTHMKSLTTSPPSNRVAAKV